MSEMQTKLGITDFVSKIKRVENYPDFEKLAHVIQYGRLKFTVKENIECESTKAKTKLKGTELDGALCKK